VGSVEDSAVTALLRPQILKGNPIRTAVSALPAAAATGITPTFKAVSPVGALTHPSAWSPTTSSEAPNFIGLPLLWHYDDGDRAHDAKRCNVAAS
jgi:hypothetical protein